MAASAETQMLLQVAAKASGEALAENLVAVDVSARLPFVEAFLLMTADNSRHLRALVGAVTQEVREQMGRSPHNVEGDNESTWLVIDYQDVIVHVFLAESREFYALDQLWADAPRVKISQGQE